MKTYVLKPLEEKMPILPTTRKQTLIDSIKNLEEKLKANINNPKLSPEQRLQLHDHYLSMFKSLWTQLNPTPSATQISGEPLVPHQDSDSEDDEINKELLKNLAHIMKTEKKRTAYETPEMPKKHVKKLKFSPNPFTPLRWAAEKAKDNLLDSFEDDPEEEKPPAAPPAPKKAARPPKPPPPPTLASTRERRQVTKPREGRGLSKSFRIRLWS